MLTMVLVAAVALGAGALHRAATQKWTGRVQALEQKLQGCAEALSQMAEIQMQAHQKFSADCEDLEERLMELSVPSLDSSLPLERRHQVLALARQGAALEDIAQRLKAPVGEAQLILNLRKYMGRDLPRAATTNEQGGPYA